MTVARSRTVSRNTRYLSLLIAAILAVFGGVAIAQDLANVDKDRKSNEKKSEKKGASESASSSHNTTSESAASSQRQPLATKATSDPSGKSIESVVATVETQPVPNAGDAADDPAIWVHPSDPAKSTIIGTDKRGGIAVYDLAGKELQYLKAGMIDNVDLRQGFKLSGKAVTLVTGGNRQDNSISIFRVNDETRLLEDIAARKITTVETYGSCMYSNPKTNKVYYFVTSKTGNLEQWELFDNGQGKVDGKKVRGFKVGGVIEGCVADDEFANLYVSEEAIGIWKYGADPESGSTRTQVDKTGPGGHLVADVEGLTIAYGPDGTGFLMASSQGNHTYVVYRREPGHEFVKTFRIVPEGAVDGAEETDGIDVLATPLGPAFPHGVFVAQDGFNDRGNQNFKLVPLERIVAPTLFRKERAGN